MTWVKPFRSVNDVARRPAQQPFSRRVTERGNLSSSTEVARLSKLPPIDEVASLDIEHDCAPANTTMQFETALQFPTIMDNLLDKNAISVSVESMAPAKCDDDQERWGARGTVCDPPGGYLPQQAQGAGGMPHQHVSSAAEDLHGCEWMNQTPHLDEYSQHFRENSADPAKSAPVFFPSDAPHDADYSGQYLGPCWVTDLNQPDAAALFPTVLDEVNSNLLVDRAPCSLDSEKKQHDMLLPVPMENLLTLFNPPAPEAHHEDAEITSLEMFCSYYEQHEGYDSARDAMNQRLDHRHERHHSLSQFHDDAAIDVTNHENHDLGARHSLCDPHLPLGVYLSSAEFPKESGNDIDDRKPFLRSSRSKSSPAAIEPVHSHQQNSPPASNSMPMPVRRLNAREPLAVTRGRHVELSSLSLFADIRMMTTLNDCYWKNGRKNLQCFPACPEHNDFYSMKMNNNKHSSVGVCRGPIYCHIFTRRADASSSPLILFHALEHVSLAQDAHSMKFAGGLGSASTGGSDHELFVLGRFERVPHRPMDDIDKNLADDLDAPPTFSSVSEFEKFRFSCFQAVEMEERRVDLPRPGARNATLESPTTRSTWFFLPDVWKVHPMLKKKRKATRSAPAQTFPFCFRVFVYTRNPAASASGSRRDSSDARFSCIAATASSFFELYSTRTVDRVKRKFWTEAEASTATGAKARKRAR